MAPRGARGAPLRRRLEPHAGAPRLGQADGDRLLGRARAVLALPHVLDLLADELAGLRRRRLALPLRLMRSLDRLLLRHRPSPRDIDLAISRAAAAPPGAARASGGFGGPLEAPKWLKTALAHARAIGGDVARVIGAVGRHALHLRIAGLRDRLARRVHGLAR